MFKEKLKEEKISFIVLKAFQRLVEEQKWFVTIWRPWSLSNENSFRPIYAQILEIIIAMESK